MVVRHDDALRRRTRGERDPLHPRHASEHHSPGRQDDEPALLRYRRPLRSAGDAGLVLLLVLGAMAELEAGGLQDRRRIAARSDPPSAEPRERLRFPLRKRWLTECRSGKGLPESLAGGALRSE